MIMGGAGSGKSTLARRLSVQTGLPIVHLDSLYWRPGWTEPPHEDFARQVETAAAGPAWVIEGNYSETLAVRLARADLLIFLDMPAWLCRLRVLWRIGRSYGRVRADMAPGCPEQFDRTFLRYVWDYPRRTRPRHLQAVAAFPGRSLILRRPGDVAALLRRADL